MADRIREGHRLLSLCTQDGTGRVVDLEYDAVLWVQENILWLLEQAEHAAAAEARLVEYREALREWLAWWDQSYASVGLKTPGIQHRLAELARSLLSESGGNAELLKSPDRWMTPAALRVVEAARAWRLADDQDGVGILETERVLRAAVDALDGRGEEKP